MLNRGLWAARIRPLVFPVVMLALLTAFIFWRAPFWAGKPAVFVDASFEQAASKAESQNRLLVVDAMASWCGPCKVMDAHTWPKSSVVEWMNAHAVAFQFDVDKQPELASRFGVSAMPTIIVLKGGVEVARTLGGKSASELVEWLESVRARAG
ncbi:MAG: thioredoxin family protein [Phycisphaerales bacterium]